MLLYNVVRFTVNIILLFRSEKQITIMDTQIANWEMSLESEQTTIIREEIATWPSEPYTLDFDSINWN